MDIKDIGTRLKTFVQRDFNEELDFLTSIRDHIEFYTSDKQQYKYFLNECLESIRSILLLQDANRKQDYKKSSIICMEILTLLPQNEVISDYCLDLAQLCLHLLDRDMDDIGTLAIRNLVFLHRNYTEKLEGIVESFLGFASRLCTDIQHTLPQLIQEIISNRNVYNLEGQEIYNMSSGSSTSKSDMLNSSNEDPEQLFFRGGFSSSLADFNEITNPVRSSVHRNSVTSGVHNSNSSSNIILPCHRSLRILTELPLALLHIFQLYPHYIERYFAIFAPNLASCLNIAALFPRDFHPKLLGSFCSSQNHLINQQFQISPEQVPEIIRSPAYKSLVQDYMIASSKIILWFVHFFRGFNNDEHISETLKQTQSGFIQGFIEVLLFCPPYCLHQRREILVCLRSILSTEFRQGFYEKIDILLDEAVLIGHGRTGYETVKVLSAAIIHELLVYLRLEYPFKSYCNSLNQESFFDSILKCLHSLTRNILDTALPLPAQHYCIRSATFLPDILKKEIFISNNNTQRNIIIRDVLLNILWVFSLKIHQLRRQIYNLLLVSVNRELPEVHNSNNDVFSSKSLKPTLKEFLDEFKEILNTGNWLESSFSYANTQLGHCEVSLMGSSALPQGLDIGHDINNQSKPSAVDVLRELRPIIRATIIGARQTVFHITTINRSTTSYTGNGNNTNNKNILPNNSSEVMGSLNNNTANLDITRYDVKKLSNGLLLNETESKLLQKIFIEGIICCVEYSSCFQYVMSSCNLIPIQEGGHECQIIPVGSLLISNNVLNQCNAIGLNPSNSIISNQSNNVKVQNSLLSIMPEEKELLELLASIMCYIHPQSFGDIIQSTFSLLFEWSTTMSPQIALIFHYWGIQQHLSKVFYESILPHLISKLDSLAVEPDSEFVELRKNSSSIQILLRSLGNDQSDIESTNYCDISSIIAQTNNINISSTPLSYSIYPTEYEKLALSRYVIDPHIDHVDIHSKIPYSRGRISHYGSSITLPDNITIIIDPRDDPNNLIKFAPTAAPHGNPIECPFPFDILTQNINISSFQLNKNLSDLPIPDTFIYENKINPKCIPKCFNGIASGLVTTRLLKQLFRYIGQNPQYETILIPYIVELSILCTSMASKYQNNIFYLSILRSLFRSITPGGKASGIYKEFLVILPWFLDTTIKMQKETQSPFREIWLEISLTVPARLKSLLPYMGQLINPMLNALESNDPELILLALRSLDLWIDNLHHDFLYPILTNSLHQPHRFQTRPSILVTLCKLLRPAPPIPLPAAQILLNNFPRFQKNNNLSFYALQSIAFQHATLVGRILGKLGGKNRWFLKDSALLDTNDNIQVRIPVNMKLNSINGKMESVVLLNMDDTMQHIYQYLNSIYTSGEPNNSVHIIRSMSYLHIKNFLLFYLSSFWVDIGTLDSIQMYFDKLSCYLQKHFKEIEDPNEHTLFSLDYISFCNKTKVIPSYVRNLELFTKSLILVSSLTNELATLVGKYCQGISTYLAIYSASRSFIPEHCNLSLYWASTNTDPVGPILSGLFEIMEVQLTISPKIKNSSVLEKPSYISLQAIKNLVSTYYKFVKKFPSYYYKRAFQTAQLPVLLTSNIVNLCYHISWSKKTAASMLIIEILNCIPPMWSQIYFTKLMDALFFISKDSGNHSSLFGERCSEDALDALIYSVFSGIKPIAIFGNKDETKSNLKFSLPCPKYGITISRNKLSLLSGESVNVSVKNWEDLIRIIDETKELKRRNPELWWEDSNRVYMEMLLFDSRDQWYTETPVREEILNSLKSSTPDEEVLYLLRKHFNHLCTNSITSNLLSLRSSCRRMAQKCLLTLSFVTGVSIATLLNISFNSPNITNESQNSTHNSVNATQTTLLQLLLSRLQTKLISTCSIPYQLAFLDTLCFIASLRPAPLGIPSTVIRRFVEDIFIVIRDEIDFEMNEGQQKNVVNGFSQNQSPISNVNLQNIQNNRNNPEFQKNRIKVQIYSIRFLKLILLHPIWSEFLRNRNSSSLSVPVSANISPIISPNNIPSNQGQNTQTNHYSQINQIQSSNQANAHTNQQNIQQVQQSQQFSNLGQHININHQPQLNTHLGHQNMQSINQQKTHFSHSIYQNQQNNLNQQCSIGNQININTQVKVVSEELRWKIIGILFRCVTRKDLEVCKAAHHTLRVVVRIERYVLNQSVNQQEDSNHLLNANISKSNSNATQYELLPEDQLRHCLRPVLVHLASATKLTVHVLQGLARLLELLCFCFNVTLGEKLLQHLQRLCWPGEYQQRDHLSSNNQANPNMRQVQGTSTGIANTQLDSSSRYEEELQMAIAMVCIFHLLPQGSDEFVAKVIGTILGTRTFPGIDGTANVQSSISSFITSYTTAMTISSPFRLPLALFATHSPQNVVMFLIQQLASDRYANFLIDLIKMGSCSVIRVKLYQLRTHLIEATVNRVLEEVDNLETKVDSYAPSTFNPLPGSSIHLNTGPKVSTISPNTTKTVPQAIPVSPAFTESYSSAWNGIRVLSSLCEEWPSLLIIDFLEYYASNNKSVITIIDTLLTLYNTIFNRLIVLTKSGGISTHGNLDNKFELTLTYQGTVSWQHPWSFFHSNECLMLFKMLIGFYTATNVLDSAFEENIKKKSSGDGIGSEIMRDISSVANSMKNVLVTSLNIMSSSSISNLSQCSTSFQRQNFNSDQDHNFPNSYSFNLPQNRLHQNSNPNINNLHTNNLNISSSLNNTTINNQNSGMYPSEELIISLLSTTVHGHDVKEHLKRRRIDVILTIATLFGTSSTLDSGVFRDFLICTVPKTLTIQEKRLLFNQLIQRYYPNNPNIDTSSILPGTQVACIQLILIPLLEYEFNKTNSTDLRQDSWLTDNICEGILMRIILPGLERNIIPLHGTFGLSASDDPLKIEVLKLLILVVKNKYCNEILSNNRKRIIKNVWNILRTESSLLKSWGYITMCYFVKKYPFPEKILFSMLIALTRLYGISEVRLIVRRALNLFIPLLYSLKPVHREENVDGFSEDNIGKKLFSFVPSPPKLSIKEKTPEVLFSKWLKLMVAILTQDSYNLPLQQQLYHWNIITLHPNIFINEHIYLISPILSTITKLLWGYNSVNSNLCQTQSPNTSSAGKNNSGISANPNPNSSVVISNNASNIPFLPEMKRNVFDILYVVTDWIFECKKNIDPDFSNSNSGNFTTNEFTEVKRRKLSPKFGVSNKEDDDLVARNKNNSDNVINSLIDISSIPQLASLLNSDDGTNYIPITDLVLTLWFRLALLTSNSDHLLISKCFNIISEILKKSPSCKLQYTWLDIGFNPVNNNTSNGISNSTRNNFQIQNQSSHGGIFNSSHSFSSSHYISLQLTLIAGLQVLSMYQSFNVIIMQLDSILQILEPTFISGEKIVTDSLYSFICKLVQIIPPPSKQLQETLRSITENVYLHINEKNKYFGEKIKELDYTYINNFKIPLSKKYLADNRIDSFYLRLIDISISGIWSAVNQELSILPEFIPTKVSVKNTNLSDNIVNNEHDLNTQVSSENMNKCNRNVSLYTAVKIISSFLLLGMGKKDSSLESIDEFRQNTGLLFMKYFSPLIIYILDKTLNFIGNNFGSQNSSNTTSNNMLCKINMTSSIKTANLSGTRVNNSTNSGQITQIQNSNNSNIATLYNCGDLLQLLFISPEVTMIIIDSKIFRNYLIQLLRDFGLITTQGGIIHILINIVGRWLFDKQINLNNYLYEKLKFELKKEEINEYNTNLINLKINKMISSNFEERKFIKVVQLDDVIKYYHEKKRIGRDVEILRYELIVALLTGWSLICDRNRRYEVHLIYHSFLEELLNNNENELLSLIFEIEENNSTKSEVIESNMDKRISNKSQFLSNKVLSQLEKCALLSLSSPHPRIKQNILKWFNNKIPSDIIGRLHYLFTTSNFDVLAERFYITQFLELLSPILSFEENLVSCSNFGRFSSLLPTIEQQIIRKFENIKVNSDSNTSFDINKDPKSKLYESTTVETEWWELQNLFLNNVESDEDTISTSSNISLLGVLGDESSIKTDFEISTNELKFKNNFDEIYFNQTSILNKAVEKLRLEPNLIMDSLLFFSNTSEALAISLWKTIFPCIWNKLTNEQKIGLTTDIIDLLSKERHHRVSSAMPSEWTIPYVILETLLLCDSPPILPSSLLLHLSTKLRCWHIAADYLKNQMSNKHVLLSNPERNEDESVSKDLDTLLEYKIKSEFYEDKTIPDNSWMILAEIYGELQEEDIVIGIRRTYSNCLETHMGLALMQQAEWSKAQEIFYNNLDAIYSSPISFPDRKSNFNDENNKRLFDWSKIFETCDSLPINNETIIWIDSWVSCAKHLNQWNTLNEFAKERRNPQLQLECSSKLQDWVLVEKLVNKYIMHNPITKLCQAYHSLYDLLLGNVNGNWNIQHNHDSLNTNLNISNQNRINNPNLNTITNNNYYYHQIPQNLIQQNSSRSKLAEFERHCSIGYRTVLNFWAMLPSIVSACHIPLLLNFQQYIELQEGFRLSSDIERKLYPDGPNNSTNQVINSNLQNVGFGSNITIPSNSATQNIGANSHPISIGLLNNHGNSNTNSHTNTQNINSNSTPGYFEARMLNVWRDRLPNKWDSMILWNDLFVWRNFVFSIIMNLISKSDNLTSQAKSLWPSYLQDMPWTMIKFASIARKSHRLPEVSVALLQRLQNHLQVSGGDAYRAETFLATLEKVKLCLSDNTQLRTGLNILNMTDFQKCPEPYFDEYRAEFLRLKGIITNKLYPNYYIDGEISNNGNTNLVNTVLGPEQGLHNLSGSSISNNSSPIVRINTDLLSSLKVYPLFARGWITWAQYTDRLLYIHQNMSYAVNAVISYLMGIYLRPDKYSILLSRVLWLLPHDSPEGKYLSLAFKKYSDFLPCAVWLPWIPQLIAGLDRIEGNALLHILNKIVLIFPQSIYFNIRSNYLEKREIAHMYWYLSSNMEGDSSFHQGPPPPSSSGIYPSFISIGWQRIEALMNTCRIRHGALTLALEHWVEDLVLHCKPDPLDELLCAIRTLFQMTVEIVPNYSKCNKNEDYNDKEDNSQISDLFPAVGAHFLEYNIIRRYNQLLNKSVNVSNQALERSRSVIQRFWNEFKNDFNVYKCDNTSASEKVPLNLKLDYVIEKLKKWKDYFTKYTEKYSSGNLSGKTLLSDLSSTLCDLFHRINIRLEVPGQNLRIVSESLYLRNFAVLENSNNNNNPIGGVIYLHRSLPIIENVVRQSYTLKRIGFITSSGSTIHFLIQPYSGLQQKVEERILHLQVTLNTLLYKYKETRSRNISFAILPCIPLHPRCRIVEDTGNKKSLTELIEQEASDVNNNDLIRDLDIPVLLHRKLLNISRKKKSGDDSNNPQLHQMDLLRIYREICENWVPGNILKNNVLKKFKSHDQSFLFIKQFTTHIGILSIFSYILGVNDVTPNKLFISTDTGQVYQSELKSSYVSSTLLIDKTEKVPFRLTRNIENLMGPFGKNGILPGTMLAFAHCLQKYEFHIRNLLCSLLRDDLHAFSVHRALQVPQTRNSNQKQSVASINTKYDSNNSSQFDNCTSSNSRSTNSMQNETISQMMQQRLLSNVEIREKVDKNVRKMMEKIAILTNPRPINENSLLIDKSILELIECSTDPNNLSAMKPTWMPWL